MQGIFAGSMSRARAAALIAVAGVLLPAAFTGRSDATIMFAAPKTVHEVPGYEPGLDIGDDGTLFVNAPEGIGTGKGKLARMRPGETSFKLLSFEPWRKAMPGSGDTDAAVAPPGPGDTGNRVYFLDMWVGSNSFAASYDNGDTWRNATPVTHVPTTDRQWIAVGKRDPVTNLDTIYIVYQQFSPPSWGMFARSTDGGLTWPYQRPFPGVTGTSTGPVHNVISKGDFVGIVYGHGNNLRFAASKDAGASWTSSQITLISDHSGDIPGVAMDPVTDDIYVTWRRTSDGSINVDRSTDYGATWHVDRYVPPKSVSTAGTSNVFPAIAAKDGKVAVAWYSTARSTASYSPDSQTNGSWRLTYAESTDRGETWSEPMNPSTIIVKQGLICTQGLACDAALGGPGDEHRRQIGDFLQIGIAPDQSAVISYSQKGTCRVIRQVT